MASLSNASEPAPTRANRFLPSTLFGRLLASLLLAVGATIAVMVVLIVQDRRDLAMRVGGVRYSSQRIAEITRTLEALGGDARAAEMKRLGSDPKLMLDLGKFEQRMTLTSRGVAAIQRTFASELRQLLGEGYQVSVRRSTRQRDDIIRLAEAVGRSIRHPPLPEEGVREIREATRAFNAMQDRLLRYLDSRTGVLAAMSHDLRTPLTRLHLRVESVADEQLRARFRADLDEMEGLVRGALALFKQADDDEGFESLDVNALLGALAAEYSELGSSVSIEGKAQTPADARPRALKRCITNLIDNAIKYGKRSSIRVDDGAALVISVSDEGPGIPEESLERVFEPFCRLESSRNRETGGTGLGLTIARDIAQAHGGTLTLRNRAEGGLTAELRLPRK